MTNKLATAMVTQVTAVGATVAVDGEEKFIRWSDLREHAAQTPQDDGVHRVYQDLLKQAAERLRALPRNEQGIYVAIKTETSGSTWFVRVYDAAGSFRRDLMIVDEIPEEPHKHLAQKTAREISDRLGGVRIETQSL